MKLGFGEQWNRPEMGNAGMSHKRSFVECPVGLHPRSTTTWGVFSVWIGFDSGFPDAGTVGLRTQADSMGKCVLEIESIRGARMRIQVDSPQSLFIITVFCRLGT